MLDVKLRGNFKVYTTYQDNSENQDTDSTVAIFLELDVVFHCQPTAMNVITLISVANHSGWVPIHSFPIKSEQNINLGRKINL